MTAKALSNIRRKLKVLNYAKEIGNISKACRYYITIYLEKLTINGNEHMKRMENKLLLILNPAEVLKEKISLNKNSFSKSPSLKNGGV